MSIRLIYALLSVFGALLIGYFTVPAVDLVAGSSSRRYGVEETKQDVRVVVREVEEVEPQGVVIDESGEVSANDEGADYAGGSAIDDESSWADDDGDYLVERNVDSYMNEDAPAELSTVEEEEIPVDPKFTGLPPVSEKGKVKEISRMAGLLAKKLEKQESADRKKPYTTGYKNEDLTPADWKQAERVYKELSDRVLEKLGKCDTASVIAFLEEPSNRLDLARLTMIRKAGVEGVKGVAEQKMGTALLYALGSDLDWMTGIMFSGPTDNLAKGLSNMALIYSRYSEDMESPVARRIAGTTATEFAREHWSEKDMIERFGYYHGSYVAGKLNVIFDTLQYWETRLVCGCNEPGGWGSPVSLAWQRDNVRLPAEGYLGACTQLEYRLRNVAGDSVFSGEYLAPVLKYMNNAVAWAHREIGGVCGACSHYGAYGALAAGIPAMAMGEPGHCAYTVRVGQDWKMSYSIYWEHSLQKTFWRMHDWDFLILMQDLYSDRYTTQVSDMLLATAEFLASRKMEKPAMELFEAATAAQALNWPAWVAYASYIKQKAPQDKARWRSVNDRIVDTMNVKFHNASATFLSAYVYPHLLPLMPEKAERNKMFSAFFKKCDNFGTNRWDITKFLNVQMSGCTSDKEQRAYMKDALRILMSKPDYAGAVLAWGLDYIASIAAEGDPENEKLQDEFTGLIVQALSRARTGKKQIDGTWAALGEAINSAAENGDRKSFQAIGRLAMRKCKKKFPKNKFKFRPFPGQIISSKGLITTATTLDPGQVPQSCLHWGVLQKTGGSIPSKFEGTSGMKVEFDNTYAINGLVILFDQKVKNDRPFTVESSEDGQNWSKIPAGVEVSGAMIRVDARKSGATGRFVRLLRGGDKWDTAKVLGFYVYGKAFRKKEESKTDK